MKSRKCSKCKSTKAVSEFPKDKTNVSGYGAQCKICKNSATRLSRSARRDELNAKSREYYRKNSEKIISQKISYNRAKYQSDDLFRLATLIRTRAAHAIRKRGFSKSKKTEEIIGCDLETLYLHLERQFKKGMSWDNRDEWHVDHIIPLASASSEEEMISLCHYTNLQPLWKSENLSKGSKVLNLI